MLYNRFPATAPAFTGTPFAVRIRDTDGTTEVSLCGEIDLANAAVIEAQLLGACVGPNRFVKVDLHAVSLIDGRGVRACLNAQRLAREQGYELVFSEPEGIVARVIRVLGLESVMLGGASDE